MPRVLVVLAVVASLAGPASSLGASVVHDAAQLRGRRLVETPNKRTLTLPEDQLARGLLALDDVPRGWAILPNQPAAAANSTAGFCNGPNEVARAQAAGLVTSVTALLAKDLSNNNTPVIGEGIDAFPTVSQAKALMESTKHAATQCPSWQPTSKPVGSSVTETARVVPFKGIADDGFAIRGTEMKEAPGQPAISTVDDLVYMRKSSYVISVSRVALSADLRELKTLAKEALRKFAALLQSRPARETGKSKAPSGFSTVVIKRAGFSIAVPDAWAKADLTRHSIDEVIRQLRKLDPKAAALVAQQRDFIARNSRFFAIDSRGAIFHDNVTVLAIPSATGSPIGHEAEIKAAYETNSGESNIQVTDTRIGRTPAVEVVGTFQETPANSAPFTAHGTSYVIAVGDGIIEIDFTTVLDGRRDPNVQTMIQSLKLLR